MSTVIDNSRLTSNANIAGPMPISSTVGVVGNAPIDVVSEISFVLPSSQTKIFLKLFISDFNSEFHLAVIDINFLREQSIYELKTELADGALLDIRFNGELNEAKDTFLIKQVSIGQQLISNHALPKFVALTFRAILALASSITLKIPEIDLNLTTTFEFPLKELSNVLQIRQLTYRVMVIEKALGIKFDLPSNHISDEEIERIAYAYHSIVKRSFDWPHIPTLYPVPAIQEVLDWFPISKEVSLLEFIPNQVVISIFGKNINLGNHKSSIKNAVIENYEEAKQELSKLDGHIVNVLVRSSNGVIQVKALDTPRLPENPWEPGIQQLVDLDSQLDEEMIKRFNKLVASTLDGLSEEMKVAVTTTPELDVMFFSSEDERE